MNMWTENANFVAENCGSYVDYDTEYYMCPECGEPILADDWDEKELARFICPICETTVIDLM